MSDLTLEKLRTEGQAFTEEISRESYLGTRRLPSSPRYMIGMPKYWATMLSS